MSKDNKKIDTHGNTHKNGGEREIFDYNRLLDILQNSVDNSTKKYNNKIINTDIDVLGVKTPFLRNLAREFCKGREREVFSLLPNNQYYEVDLFKAILIGNTSCCLSEKFEMIDSFKHFIENWAVCDCVCMGLKLKDKEFEEGGKGENEKSLWQYCLQNLLSDHIFSKRLALVVILTNFSSRKQYTEAIFDLLTSLAENSQYGEYYFDMAAAWLLSYCMIYFPEATYKYLSCCRLPEFVFCKAISKSCESYRVSQQYKIALKNLKNNRQISK